MADRRRIIRAELTVTEEELASMNGATLIFGLIDARTEADWQRPHRFNNSSPYSDLERAAVERSKKEIKNAQAKLLLFKAEVNRRLHPSPIDVATVFKEMNEKLDQFIEKHRSTS